MSLFKPKDDDYIMRGLILLVAWMLFGLPVFTFLCGLVLSFPGLIAGGVGGVALGLWGYSAYLNYGLRVIREKANRITNDPDRIEKRKAIAPAFTVPRKRN